MSKEIIGEFLGTFVLILFGTGFGLSNNLNKTYSRLVGNNWLGITISWGIAVTLGVYTSLAIGAPAHLNPALSLGISLSDSGSLPLGMAIVYSVAQILGALLGAMVAAVPFWLHFRETTPEEGNTVGCFATTPSIDNPLFNFIGEVVATFAFVFPVQFMTRKGVLNIELLPIALGLLVIAVGLAFGSMTGYAINPARDLGPRLAYTLLPIPNKEKKSSKWNYAWVPILGPIVGALIAIFLAKYF